MMIETVGVGFRRRGSEILAGVDLALPVGLTGLLGPNGAGKTTLLRILATGLTPTSGDVSIAGMDGRQSKNLPAIRRHLGYLPQKPILMPLASAQKNVTYAAWAHGLEPAECESAAVRALALVDLADTGRKPVRFLSGGQQQRVALACATVHQPQILLLDEPTVGLDVSNRRRFNQALAEVAKSACVVMSTHLLADIYSTATRLVVLNRGRILFDDTPAALRQLGQATESSSDVLEEVYMRLLEGADRAQ